MAGTIGESLTRMEVDIPPLATHIQPTFAFVLFLFLPARVCKYYNVKKSWNSCAIVLGIIFFSLEEYLQMGRYLLRCHTKSRDVK